MKNAVRFPPSTYLITIDMSQRSINKLKTSIVESQQQTNKLDSLSVCGHLSSGSARVKMFFVLVFLALALVEMSLGLELPRPVECSFNLSALSGYSPLVPPSTVAADGSYAPAKVTLNLTIFQVAKADDQDQTIQVTYGALITWFDWRLAPQSIKSNTEQTSVLERSYDKILFLFQVMCIGAKFQNLKTAF